jgi:hypothetical protein
MFQKIGLLFGLALRKSYQSGNFQAISLHVYYVSDVFPYGYRLLATSFLKRGCLPAI